MGAESSKLNSVSGIRPNMQIICARSFILLKLQNIVLWRIDKRFGIGNKRTKGGI